MAARGGCVSTTGMQEGRMDPLCQTARARGRAATAGAGEESLGGAPAVRVCGLGCSL